MESLSNTIYWELSLVFVDRRQFPFREWNYVSQMFTLENPMIRE